VDKFFVGENVRNFLQLTPRNNSIIPCNKYTFVGKRGGMVIILNSLLRT